MSISKEIMLEMYKRMDQVRKFEEKVCYFFSKGMIHGTTHLSIGQEASSVAAVMALDDGDLVSGSTLTVVKEGSRAIIMEVESLVSKTFTPYPTRIAETLGKDKLNTLISILEQRGGIGLYDKNVIIKTTGGMRIKEQGINLAVIMSIVSSVKQRGIEANIAFIADVGLTGELKKVPSLEIRVKELARMGFKKVYVAKDSFSKDVNIPNIKIMAMKTLNDVIADVYITLKG